MPNFWTPALAGVTAVVHWVLFMATSNALGNDLLEKEISGRNLRQTI
jgi:hypothetical protein